MQHTPNSVEPDLAYEGAVNLTTEKVVTFRKNLNERRMPGSDSKTVTRSYEQLRPAKGRSIENLENPYNMDKAK